MALPKVIELGPWHTKVRFDADLPIDVAGMWDVDAAEISLKPGLAHDRVVEVTVHESLHALVWMAGLGFDEDVEESVVGRLAPLVVEWIRRNPRLVAFIQEKTP